MECQASDSKKLFKVFDASKRRKSRKKREGLDDSRSVASDGSASGGQGNMHHVMLTKHSLQEIATAHVDVPPEIHKRDRDSSPSVSHSPALDAHRSSRSPRRHRRPQREGLSLALKAGLVSTPRSVSPHKEDSLDHLPQDQDSFIYAFLEETIKRDKRKQRHSRRHEERRPSKGREPSPAPAPAPSRDHRHHHHHHRRRDEDTAPKEHHKQTPVVDQTALMETFAKLCAHISDKAAPANPIVPKGLNRSHSHKSLQCEVMLRRDYDVDQQPVRLRSRDVSRTEIPSCKVRRQDNFPDSRTRLRSPDRVSSSAPISRKENNVCCPPYERVDAKYSSKLDVVGSRMRNVPDDSLRHYPPHNCPTRSIVNHSYRPHDPLDSRDPPNARDTRYFRDPRDSRDPRESSDPRDSREPHESRDRRDFRDDDYRRYRPRQYEDDRRRFCEHKTSRSFEVQREVYDEDRYGRRTTRSDSHKKRYEDPRDFRDRRYDERMDRFYDHKGSRDRHYSNLPSKDRRSKRNLERFEETSVASREDDYRERDSGLSVADDSTGNSNCLRVVKQEIAKQREAMDKMMKLWKDLMRCFKSSSHSQESDKVNESAATMQESAESQLRLWRECMRRYETVARDVGDTDARLMEEITKQRSEMAEMATMWQDCLQRYRDMSNDFNSLKKQLASTESPTRDMTAPLVCAEGEGPLPPAPYRLPPNPQPTLYPQPPMGAMPVGGYVGSPLRSRASAPPPAWWWASEQPPPPPRRRSSPESRASRSRERRRRKDRDEPRYKEKSSKPAAARSEHRHRKR